MNSASGQKKTAEFILRVELRIHVEQRRAESVLHQDRYKIHANTCIKNSIGAEHRVHWVLTAAFWRIFHHEGKISPGLWGWGVHANPLSLHLPSPVKLQCTRSSWVDRFTDPVSSIVKKCTLWRVATCFAREYWMIYRGPGFFAVVFCGSLPTPSLASVSSAGDAQEDWERETTWDRRRCMGGSQKA